MKCTNEHENDVDCELLKIKDARRPLKRLKVYTEPLVNTTVFRHKTLALLALPLLLFSAGNFQRVFPLCWTEARLWTFASPLETSHSAHNAEGQITARHLTLHCACIAPRP